MTANLPLYPRAIRLPVNVFDKTECLRVPQVFVDQLMGHAGGLAQTYAKVDEFRREAIDRLEAFITS